MRTSTMQLYTHRQNVDRYENMLKTELTDLERRFVQRRLSEERFSIAILQFISPSPRQRGIHLPDALREIRGYQIRLAALVLGSMAASGA